ncbi:metallophosphoesterase [Myxococcus sp. XM-1-1-1]|uniref:metallophosphoesterase n=1 Tax=Myxococcus sp. XM-1-1-1 TaxID=2874602 RepID=UPI001CC1994F|nr:metallophosphoesterase [Myxococcus sp. XM-1-1-1]BDT32090.1 metallophosphoesterase [Myxococcus sp. MH1]
MRIVWTFVWHFLSVLSILVVVAAGIGLHEGVDIYYGETTEAFKAGDEGPHVFQQGGQWVSQTLRGNREEGFWVEEKRHALTDTFQLEVSFPLDRSRFSVQATPEFATPPSRYQDSGPVLALSDIEGNYKALRDFLVHARVMDAQLNWTFGEGHLVLLGDFVDRGPSVTQVLWLIYKLEHSARQAGGRVHYILGNHEIKSLQGDLHSSHQKYFNVATILGRQQSELFGDDSFLGRWLMSKNTIEVINGVLFVHGGLHPALAERDHSLDDLNRIVREHYRQRWYPRRGAGEEELLLDTKTGPSWYRGYFKEDLTQEQVEQTLSRFDAKAVVVGHTLNWRVTTLFDKKVFAIDVKHPLDHRESLPPRHSEGLLLEGDAAWRVLEDGSRVEL